jgi:hypothetical protein
MQAELEKWIEENKVMAHIFNEHGEHMVPLNALRALLADKVLCDAEPVAWLCSAADGNVDATPRSFVREDYRRFGRTITNLYAPADIGKEGGE